MNLYVVLAIALGAISGVAQPPAPRSSRPAVVLADVRAVESEVHSGEKHQPTVSEQAEPQKPKAGATKTIPLAGAATPRAPSTTR